MFVVIQNLCETIKVTSVNKLYADVFYSLDTPKSDTTYDLAISTGSSAYSYQLFKDQDFVMKNVNYIGSMNISFKNAFILCNYSNHQLVSTSFDLFVKCSTSGTTNTHFSLSNQANISI